MTTTNAEIRRAGLQDAQAIAAIIDRVVQEPNPVGLTSALDETQVAGWLRRLGDEGCIFVVSVDGRPVGFAALDYNTEEPETGTLGAWVIPEYRRRGLAIALGEAVLDFAREKGYRRIKGRLPANNEPALSFLSSLGALVPLQNPELRFELPL